MCGGMTLDGYQDAAMRTGAHPRGEASDKALGWNALGIAGESGEVADLVKKVIGHKHPLDRHKLAMELGDVLWYVATIAKEFDLTLSEIADMNIKKLMKRYPEGFSVEKSINRVE